MNREISLAEATRVWAKIGLTSFGGPAGQIALMHRILVDEKRWIGETQFLHALNFCMLLPGPEAQQLATYVGWLLHRVRGGLIAGTLFILPGLAVILALSFVYVRAGDVPLVEGLFTGLKAAVVAIVLQAVIRIGRRSMKTSGAVMLALAGFLAMTVWHVPFPYVVASAALAGALLPAVIAGAAAHDDEGVVREAVPAPGLGYVLRTVIVFGVLWLAPSAVLLAVLGPGDVFPSIAVFFSKMAVVTFGGAYAVLAYVSQEAVTTYGWLAPGEMIDGLAMAETTPGPLIMVTQFVGFVAAYRDPGGLPAELAAVFGALLTTWVTFAPCFLWIFAGAPYIERLRHNRTLSAALAGVTAAVVGVIVHLALWFSVHSLFDEVTIFELSGGSVELPVPETLSVPALVITLLAIMLVFGLRSSVTKTLAAAGTAGMLYTLI